MKKIIYILTFILFLTVTKVNAEEAHINYICHVQDYGWLNTVKDDELCGTTGVSKRVEAIKINLNSDISGSIEYSIHVQDYGWLPFVKDNQLGGTTGQSKRAEAIKIKLTGEIANKYDIYYQVHVQDYGWLPYVKNGEIAGTTGKSKRMEAIKIKLVAKGDIKYSSHVQDYGWMNYINNNEISGTTGISKRLEAFTIKANLIGNSNIEYQSYIENQGWQNKVHNNETSGTTGIGKKIEAIKINLTGDMANTHDIYYRVHVSNIGWLGWTKNGEIAGSIGNDTQIEAIQINLLGKNAPGINTGGAFVTGIFKQVGNITKYYDYFGREATGWKFIDGKKCYFDQGGRLISNDAKHIIDVSSYQKDIDWQKVKNSGIDGAIIRVGWGKSYDDPAGNDSKFKRNIEEVKKYNIPYAIYIYGYAKVDRAAISEAEFVISKMKEYNIPNTTRIYYDAENQNMPKETYETVIPLFMNTLKNNGYTNVGVYSNLVQLSSSNGNLNSPIIKQYPIWIAQYYKKLQYYDNYVGWQYTDALHIDGIEGNVDASIFHSTF